MIEIIPYFGGLITVLFSIGFALAIREPGKKIK
jgi:hypothetical protein